MLLSILFGSHPCLSTSLMISPFGKYVLFLRTSTTSTLFFLWEVACWTSSSSDTLRPLRFLRSFASCLEAILLAKREASVFSSLFDDLFLEKTKDLSSVCSCLRRESLSYLYLSLNFFILSSLYTSIVIFFSSLCLTALIVSLFSIYSSIWSSSCPSKVSPLIILSLWSLISQ